jgi:hypothetical protein
LRKINVQYHNETTKVRQKMGTFANVLTKLKCNSSDSNNFCSNGK